ncbi:MAG: hypothetical protein P8008_03455 [Gammaproteobacteria bacterium]
MKLFTLIEQNRPGLLAEIATHLERLGVNVRDINGDISGNQAVITLRAEPHDDCYNALRDAGSKVFTAEHLLVRIEDHPGALADLSRRLANEQVDIRSIHFVDRDGAQCIVALETDDPFRAGQVLQDIRVHEID